MAKKDRQLPEVLEYDFIISDESVNRYGWRLLVAGIDLTSFLKNPICLSEHQTWSVPVGRWKNLRIEGKELKGTVEFDRNDEDAVKLYWKYADGFMAGVSLNILPVEESDETAMLLPTQKYATVVKSELLEISLVSLPAQGNSVKLSQANGKEYKLNFLTINKMAKEEKTVAELQAELDEQRKLNAENLIKLHQVRGVVTDGEIASLRKLALTGYGDVSAMLEARTAVATPDDKSVAVDAMLKLHFERGAITSEEIPMYKLSCTANYEGVKKVLEAKAGTDGMLSFVAGMATGDKPVEATGTHAGWSYYDYVKKDAHALSLLKKNAPDKYNQLVASYQQEAIASGLIGKDNE